MAGSGRVEMAELTAAIRAAKVAHADCASRLQGAQRYIQDVVRPE